MATDLAALVRDACAEGLSAGDAAWRLEPALTRLFIHEFNNRHSAVSGFVTLLRRADALPPGRGARILERLAEASDRTGLLAHAFAFLTAPPETGDTPAEQLLVPLALLAAPHLEKMTGLTVECECSCARPFRTAGPLAAKLLMYAAARLAHPGGTLLARAAEEGGVPTLTLSLRPGVPPPDEAASRDAAMFLAAIPGCDVITDLGTDPYTAAIQFPSSIA